MKLRTWLRRRRLTHAQFGELIGSRQQTVSRWVSGLRIPDPKQIALIHRATRGKVSFFDWVKLKS
jgi:transcriptional regulator with XRE-family HTH domain